MELSGGSGMGSQGARETRDRKPGWGDALVGGPGVREMWS